MRNRRHEEYIFNCAALRLGNADAATNKRWQTNARRRNFGERRLTVDIKTK